MRAIIQFSKMAMLIALVSTTVFACKDSDEETSEPETKQKVSIQLIRNATMKITYAGHTFLTDPMLSPKGAMNPFAGIERNPTIEPPMDINEIIENVEAVLVTHFHPDHFDPEAAQKLSKDLPLIYQAGDNGDSIIHASSFKNLNLVEQSFVWNEITFTAIEGKHGSGDILAMMGKSSGFVLQANNQPTIYWIGDCIWDADIEEAIETYKPEIIIANSGGAVIPGFSPILMDEEETITVANAAPDAKVIAIHMESLDHCPVTRESLRTKADSANISSSRLLIPENGDILEF